MGNVIRAALPGYNALTDTDPSHFSLYSDQDNVLIKEFTRDGATIGVNNGSPDYTITHNLGYIPFFIVYAFDPVSSKWEIVPHFLASASVPKYAALADTTKIYISNFYQSTVFKWIIFYDNIVGSSANNVVLSPGIRVAKQGVNADTSKDPNEFIFHSDFNTLKIIKEDTINVTSTGAGSYSFNHNSPVDKETAFLMYCEFPDGPTALIPGGLGAGAKNVSTYYVRNLRVTSTQFTFDLGAAGVYKLHYFIFEMPLGANYTWSIPRPAGQYIVVAKPGYRADTQLHPDNLKFDSRFDTLKYAVSGDIVVTCSGNNEDKTVEVTIVRPDNKKCVFIPYVNNIFTGGATNRYALAPHTSNTATTAHEANVYVDNYYYYFKLRIKESGAFNYSAHFYYKIFKNLL